MDAARDVAQVDNPEPIAVEDGRGWMIWVQRDLWTAEGLSLCEKGAYTLLCGYADTKSRSCYPSVARIARDLGITKHTARNALDKLVEKGLLRREYRRAKGERVNDTNLYTVLPFPASPTPARAVGQPVPQVGQQLPYGDRLPTAADTPGVGQPVPQVGQQLPTNETHVTKPMERNPEGTGAAAPGADAPSEVKPRRAPVWAEQFDAIIEVCDVPPEKIAAYRGEANGAAKKLGTQGYGAESIRAGVAEYANYYPEPEKWTPSAVAKWVPRLVNPDGSPVQCTSPPRVTQPNGTKPPPSRPRPQGVTDELARQFGQAPPSEIAAKYARYERRPGADG